jgi:hypothetical protein
LFLFFGVMGELIAATRRLQEETLSRVKRLELALSVAPRAPLVHTTSPVAAPPAATVAGAGPPPPAAGAGPPPAVEGDGPPEGR